MSLGRKAPIAAAIVAGLLPAGSQIGYARSIHFVSESTAVAIPVDNTIPQITEGKDISGLAIAYQPKRIGSVVEVEVTIPYLANSAAQTVVVALFKDGVADAVQTVFTNTSAAANSIVVPTALRYTFITTNLASVSFSVRYGTVSGTTYLLSNGPDFFGATDACLITVREISTVDIAVGSGATVGTSGFVIGSAYVSSSVADTNTTVIPQDNTIPQISEGQQYTALNIAYSPKLASSMLVVEFDIPWIYNPTTQSSSVWAIFRDSGVDAIQVAYITLQAGTVQPLRIKVRVAAGSTVPTTFTLRYGAQSAGLPITILGGSAVPLFSTADIASAQITEIAQEAVALPTGGSVITPWVSEPLTITAVTTNPTKGTIVNDKIWWRRNGDSMECRIDYEQSTAGTAGSGVYLFTIPDGKTIDGSKCRISTSVAATRALGGGTVTDAASYSVLLFVAPYDTTRVRLADTAGGQVSSTNRAMSATAYQLSAYFTVPIVGWG